MIHENERLAFQCGAEAMRQACMCEFNYAAAMLRQQQADTPKEVWSIAADLRLSAEIADQEHSAYIIQNLPAPRFEDNP